VAKNMYVVFESGGKQHRAKLGDRIRLEKIEQAPGESVEFDRVLLVGEGSDVKVGAPYLTDSNITAEVIGHGRLKKIKIIKFRRRKHHMKQAGHRQWYTEVKIMAIGAVVKA